MSTVTAGQHSMSFNFGFEEVVNVPPHETHNISSNDYFNWEPAAENEDFNFDEYPSGNQALPETDSLVLCHALVNQIGDSATHSNDACQTDFGELARLAPAPQTLPETETINPVFLTATSLAEPNVWGIPVAEPGMKAFLEPQQLGPQPENHVKSTATLDTDTDARQASRSPDPGSHTRISNHELYKAVSLENKFDEMVWAASSASNSDGYYEAAHANPFRVPFTKERKANAKSRRESSKRRNRLPLSAVAILDDWFIAHRDNPYLTPGELSRLVEQSGLTRTQVSTWLSNARARKPQQTPIEAYATSSSDDEAAKEEDIRKAAESMPNPFRSSSSMSQQVPEYATSASGSSASAFDQCPTARKYLPARRGRKSYGRHRSYASSRASSAGSASSTGSAYAGTCTLFSPPAGSSRIIPTTSNSTNQRTQVDQEWNPESNLPYGCAFISKGCSQRFSRLEDLRQHQADYGHFVDGLSSNPIVKTTTEEQQNQLPKTFQCTFCHKPIPEKSWKRHEESQHYHQREWICMPCGYPTSLARPYDCVVCRWTPIFSDDSHNCHRIRECLARPQSERTFQRKDKLKQHIKQFHGVGNLDETVLFHWERRAEEQTWQCGFCGEMLANWNVRARHIANHFRNGCTMDNWRSSEFWAAVQGRTGKSKILMSRLEELEGKLRELMKKTREQIQQLGDNLV